MALRNELLDAHPEQHLSLSVGPSAHRLPSFSGMIDAQPSTGDSPFFSSLLGSVVQFDFDIPTQTLTAGLGVIAAEGDEWHRLTATFGKVIVFDFDGKIPVVISPECLCDSFEELSTSELLKSVALEKIWTTLSRGGRSRVITSHVSPSAFRHFRLAAGFFWAEWLCAEVTFDLAEQPEPPGPGPVKADRNPFA